MPYPAVATDIHEPFDVHPDIGPKVSLNGKFGVDYFSDAVKLFLGNILDLFIDVDVCLFTYLQRRRSTDSEYVGKGNLNPFIIWYINSCNTSHDIASLPDEEHE